MKIVQERSQINVWYNYFITIAH